MISQEVTLVCRTATMLAKNSQDLLDQLTVNPSQFFIDILLNFGINIPEGFHSHIIEEGEALPEEPQLKDKSRSILIIKKDNSLEQRVILPSYSDEIVVAGGNKCKTCNICVVIEL